MHSDFLLPFSFFHLSEDGENRPSEAHRLKPSHICLGSFILTLIWSLLSFQTVLSNGSLLKASLLQQVVGGEAESTVSHWFCTELFPLK